MDGNADGDESDENGWHDLAVLAVEVSSDGTSPTEQVIVTLCTLDGDTFVSLQVGGEVRVLTWEEARTVGAAVTDFAETAYRTGAQASNNGAG